MKSHEARWKSPGDGCEVIESKLKLSGWSQERWIVLVRPKPRLELKDLNAPLPSSEEWEVTSPHWEGKIAVLVTSLNQIAYPRESIAKFY